MAIVGRLSQYASMLATEFNEITANNPSITGLGTYYASEFNENVGIATTMTANVFPPYDPVYDEFAGVLYGPGQGRYMRQNTDKSVIVYNEINEVTSSKIADFRDIVRSGLVFDLDAGIPASYADADTTWRDLSGNGNNGTLTNGPTYSGANGGSIVFDGVDDYVGLTNPSTLRNQNFSVSIWFNPEVQTNIIVSMIDFDHSNSPNQGWILQSEDATTNRYFYFAWHDGTTFQPLLGYGAGKGIQITTSVWQNITYTKTGTSLLGYKNGTQVYTGTATNGNVSYVTNRNLFIGSIGGSRNFKGNISNTQIYNRALSAAEISQNFNALRNRFGL
jgi:hypothetical protein